MSPPAGTVASSDSIGILVKSLADGGVQAIPVVDQGKLTGIITRSDLLAALAHMPDASGVALGFDRLVMLATGARRIDDVLWTPLPA